MTNKKFVVESHSPYFLHSSEGPEALITAVIFDGKNYDVWEKAVRSSLKSKNKLGFTDGKLTKPHQKKEKTIPNCESWR